LMESLANEGVKVRTLATQNPAGMDLERWKEMKVSPQFAIKQLRICNAYKDLGIKPVCTCTPYLSGNRPKPDEIVGFSESSAVAYVNSVIGARTNRHGGLDALSCALVGKVPLMGLLLNENRSGSVCVDIEFEPNEESDYAAIGYYAGKNLKTGEIPLFTGLKNVSSDDLKLLGAAAAAAGSVGLFHVLDVTPEAKNKQLVKKWNIEERLNMDKKALKSVYDELSITEPPDLVCLGCPHCSIKEVRNIANKLNGRKIIKGLYFRHFGESLQGKAEVSLYLSDDFKLHQMITIESLAKDTVRFGIHHEVGKHREFRYVFAETEVKYSTSWILVFNDSCAMVGLTIPIDSI